MLRVALTGGIATGKSHVRRYFSELGVVSIDADSLVHKALEPGTPATTRIAARFGPRVLGPDGAVDRHALGRLVFADPAARRELEALLHPGVYADIDAWFEAQRSRGARLAVADIPLLYETGHENDFDVVVVAACDPDAQVHRMMVRDGLSAEAARRRLDAQQPIDAKAARADFVISTTGSLDDTRRQVRDVYERLQQRAGTSDA